MWIVVPVATQIQTLLFSFSTASVRKAHHIILRTPKTQVWVKSYFASFLEHRYGGATATDCGECHCLRPTERQVVVVVTLCEADGGVLRWRDHRKCSFLVVSLSSVRRILSIYAIQVFVKDPQIGGLNPELCRLLKTDSSTNFAVSPVCVGTTSSTAVDPLPALAKVAKNNKIWFHVDAAYAGSACICPEYHHYIDGVEEADSCNMNAHKWFLTNFECSLLWVKDRGALIQSLSTNPEFLKNKASQGNMVIDYKDWQIPLGRRFRCVFGSSPLGVFALY